MASFALRINSISVTGLPSPSQPKLPSLTSSPCIPFYVPTALTQWFPLQPRRCHAHCPLLSGPAQAVSAQSAIRCLTFVTRAGFTSSVELVGPFLASVIGFPRISNISCVSLLGHCSVYKGVLFVLALLPILLDPELLVGKMGSYSVCSPQNLVQNPAHDSHWECAGWIHVPGVLAGSGNSLPKEYFNGCSSAAALNTPRSLPLIFHRLHNHLSPGSKRPIIWRGSFWQALPGSRKGLLSHLPGPECEHMLCSFTFICLL